MKKQILSEKFKRMKKLAGIIKEEEEYDDSLELLYFPHDVKILAQDIC